LCAPGFRPNLDSPLFATTKSVDTSYASMKDYYQMVYENMVTSVRNQTAYLIYNPWARGMVAEHHVDFEGALDLSVADSASNNGYCLVPGSDPQQDTIAFNLADVTIRYSAYQQLLPVAFQVCA